MAFNLPTGAADNTREGLFNKSYVFTSSIAVSASGAWEFQQITASRLEDFLDVARVGVLQGYGLQYSTASNTWTPTAGPVVGITDVALSSTSVEIFYSESRYHISKSDDSVDSFTITPSLYFESGASDPGRRFFTGSTEITASNVSASVEAGFVLTATSASYYENDHYLSAISHSNTTNTLTFTVKSGSSYPNYNFDLSAFTDVDTVNGKSPDANGNVNIPLIKTITGPDAARPASSGDGDSYVVVDDPDPLLNGTTYIYSTSSVSWFNITPTSFDVDDRLFVNLSGDTMTGRLYLKNNPPITGSEMATKGYLDSFTSSLNTEDGLKGFGYYLNSNQSLVGSWNSQRTLIWNQEDYNDTSGSMGADGGYVVPAGVSRMIFDAGIALSANNNPGRRFRILRKLVGGGFRTLAAESAFRTANDITYLQIHSGLQNVDPGDVIYVQVLTRHTVTGLGGVTQPTFFRGYIAQPPLPLGVQSVLAGTGIAGGGSTDPINLAIDTGSVATTGSNAFNNRLTVNGAFNVDGDVNLRALQVNATASFTGSTTFVGQVIGQGLQDHANDTSAAAAGIPINGLYRNGNRVIIRII